MDSAVIQVARCPSCGGSISNDARFCEHCGRKMSRSTTDLEPTFKEGAAEFARGVSQEAKTLVQGALRSDTGKKVVAGAAIGAVAGAALPLVTIGVGATLGAGYIAFKRLTR